MIVLDEYLQRREIEFRTPVLAVAIGIYLPFELEVPIFTGGLIAWFVHRGVKADGQNQNGLLLASGLITGEALAGIMLAIPMVIFQRTDILTISDKPLVPVLGVILLAVVALWLWRAGDSERVVRNREK